MQASDIFRKTARGQTEMETKSDALSLKQRRVLILVNGENDIERLKQLSLCDNTEEILDVLLAQGFIERADETATVDSRQTTEPAADIGPREFMSNTLLTFGNRVRVAKLLEEIGSVDDIDGLKQLVKPWYRAISETPGGMYQADDLRNEVNRLIENENSGALQ